MLHVNKTITALLAGTVLTLGLAGCSSAASDVPDALAPDVDPRTVTYPLASYTSGDESVRTFERARMYVAVDCLREFGFDVKPWEPEGGPAMAWDRYGLWNGENATSIGYVPPPTTSGDPTLSLIPDEAWSSHVYDGGFTEFGEHRYNGKVVPEGGCQGEGLRAIGEVGDWDRNYQEKLVTEAGESAKADSRVAEKVKDWTSCMKDAGYDYPDPMTPFGEWSKDRESRQAEQGENVPASKEEIAAATTDVNCKISTKLLATWIAVEIENQNTIIAREGDALVQWKAQVDASLTKARQIIQEHES